MAALTTDGPIALAARVLGAVSLLAVGVIHVQQYVERDESASPSAP